MAIELIDKIKPKNNGGFVMVDAEDVAMPDGTRLSECEFGCYKVVEGATVIEPNKYYVFGEVSNLTVTLTEADKNMTNEYCFEFIATDDFDNLTIIPEPKWVVEPSIGKGRTHQVSILRGIGVMVCA